MSPGAFTRNAGVDRLDRRLRARISSSGRCDEDGASTRQPYVPDGPPTCEAPRMSSLEPRRGSGMSRNPKGRRASRLVVTGPAAGLVAGVGTVLAIVGVIGGGIPLIAAIVAIVCLFMFRRLTASRSGY